MQTSLNYIKEVIAKAKKGEFTLIQALSISYDIESALLERYLVKHKEAVPKEIRVDVERLAKETQRHMNTIRDLFNSERQKK